jgi:hypothetical protein
MSYSLPRNRQAKAKSNIKIAESPQSGDDFLNFAL